MTDLVSAMLWIRNKSNEKLSIFNVGPLDDGVTVRFIAESVVNVINSDVNIKYGYSNKGWIGDVPRFRYTVDKLLSLGWRPKLTSAQAIQRAVFEINKQYYDI